MNCKDMKVIIPIDVMAKIKYWVDKCPKEISGMGTVRKDADAMYVTDVFLLDQEVTCVDTEITAEAIGKLEFELHKSSNNDSLNFWWHSHVNMGTQWSGTDYEQMDQFSLNGGWILATVVNKQGDIRTAYRQGCGEIYPSVFVDNIETTSSTIMDDKLIAKLDSDYASKVKIKNYQHTANIMQHNINATWTAGDKWINGVGWVTPKNKHGKKNKNNNNKHTPTINKHEKVVVLSDGEAYDLTDDTNKGIIADWGLFAEDFWQDVTDSEILDFYETYRDDPAMVIQKNQYNEAFLKGDNYDILS